MRVTMAVREISRFPNRPANAPNGNDRQSRGPVGGRTDQRAWPWHFANGDLAGRRHHGGGGQNRRSSGGRSGQRTLYTLKGADTPESSDTAEAAEIAKLMELSDGDSVNRLVTDPRKAAAGGGSQT